MANELKIAFIRACIACLEAEKASCDPTYL